MAQFSTGLGLAVLGISAVTCVALSNARFGSLATASASPAITTITTAALAQTEPTIVWYGTESAAVSINSESYMHISLTRAWSDGRVEMKFIRKQITSYIQNPVSVFCEDRAPCSTGWRIVSDPNQGYAVAADLDFNEEVDAGDIAMVLLNYGDAPRQDIPPSDCPLNLINPR